MGTHEAERRRSLGQLKSVGDVFPVFLFKSLLAFTKIMDSLYSFSAKGHTV